MEGMRSGYLGANPARTKRPIHVSPPPPPPQPGGLTKSQCIYLNVDNTVLYLYLRPGPLLVSGSG